MGLPPLDYYNPAELAKLWAKRFDDCTTDYVIRLIDTGKLKAEWVPEKMVSRYLFENQEWDGRQPIYSHHRSPGFYKISLEEIQRFEVENGMTASLLSCGEGSKPLIQETAAALCSRLKSENLDDKAIAKKLKKSFPTFSNGRIARLIFPAEDISKGAYSKRGKRLLE